MQPCLGGDRFLYVLFSSLSVLPTKCWLSIQYTELQRDREGNWIKVIHGPFRSVNVWNIVSTEIPVPLLLAKQSLGTFILTFVDMYHSWPTGVSKGVSSFTIASSKSSIPGKIIILQKKHEVYKNVVTLIWGSSSIIAWDRLPPMW